MHDDDGDDGDEDDDVGHATDAVPFLEALERTDCEARCREKESCNFFWQAGCDGPIFFKG